MEGMREHMNMLLFRRTAEHPCLNEGNDALFRQKKASCRKPYYFTEKTEKMPEFPP